MSAYLFYCIFVDAAYRIIKPFLEIPMFHSVSALEILTHLHLNQLSAILPFKISLPNHSVKAQLQT
jgi:hypothetical protein